MPTKTKPVRQRRNDQGLTITQQSAADLLALGKSDTEIAKEIGVARETVCRWRTYSPVFQAELNARRAAIRQGTVDRLRCMVGKAFMTLEALLEGDHKPETKLKAAAEILKLAQLPSLAERIGPEDPDKILRDLVEDERLNTRDMYDDMRDRDMGLPPFEAHLTARRAELEALANSESRGDK